MMLYWMQEELCFCQGSTTIVLCETIIFHEFESNQPICSGSPNGRQEKGRECFGHSEDCQGGEGSHYSGQDLEGSFRDFQRIFLISPPRDFNPNLSTDKGEIFEDFFPARYRLHDNIWCWLSNWADFTAEANWTKFILGQFYILQALRFRDWMLPLRH